MYTYQSHEGSQYFFLGVYCQEVQKTLRRKRRGDAEDQMCLWLPLIL